jgi:hypothetical protein
MIDRPSPATVRVRAGSQQQPALQVPRHWMNGRAPSLRSLARDCQQRRERVWAWLSLVALIICWDASSRLEAEVAPPRARVAHLLEEDELFEVGQVFSVDL